LEAATDAGRNVQRLRRLGLPDRFIEHGERRALLADVGLDADGVVQACLAMAHGADMLCGAGCTGN
jgi:1-deoxy-D-xylulose-5-phosphate synthase